MLQPTLNRQRIVLIAEHRPIEEIEIWLRFLTQACNYKGVIVSAQHWKLRKLKVYSNFSNFVENRHFEADREIVIPENLTLTICRRAAKKSELHYWSLGGFLRNNAPSVRSELQQLNLDLNSSFESDFSDVNFHKKVPLWQMLNLCFRKLGNTFICPKVVLVNVVVGVLRLLLLFFQKPLHSRTFLSLNWRSAEFKNLVELARLPTPTLVFFVAILPRYTHYFMLEARSTYDHVLASWLDRYCNIEFCYIGLPGARIVCDIVPALTANVTTIHVNHGRVTSPKFLFFTHYVFSRVKDDFNCNHLKLCRETTEFIFGNGAIAWVHGYKKGRPYSVHNLKRDLRTLRNILSDHPDKDLYVFAHPTAHMFRRVLKVKTALQARLFLESLKSGKTLKVEMIYSSSPTFKTYSDQKRTTTANRRNAIKIIDLRK